MNLIKLLNSTTIFPSGSGLTALIFGLVKFLFNLVGNYGIAIILFTLVLRLIMTPLDFGNKYFTKKNTKKMAELKPQLDNINKIYANDALAKNRAQQDLFRKNGYGQGGFCLFMLINLVLSLVIFLTVFNSLREISNVNINNQFVALQGVYAEYEDSGSLDSAEFAAAVNAKYDEYNIPFLWVKNFWRPDNWASQTMSWSEFQSSVSGTSGSVFKSDAYLDADSKYLIAAAIDSANPTATEKIAAHDAYIADLKSEYEMIFNAINPQHKGWNGLLILIALAAITMYFSTAINMNQMKKKATDKKTSPEIVRYSMRETRAAPDASAVPEINPMAMGKMMQFLLPVIMIFFTLSTTAALALYITAGAIISTGFTFVNNALADKLLEKQDRGKGTTGTGKTVINPHTKYFKGK